MTNERKYRKPPVMEVPADRFMKHAEAWQNDCAYLSSVQEMAIHGHPDFGF